MQSSGDYIRQVIFVFLVLLVSQIAFLCIAIWYIIPERNDDFDIEFRIIDVVIFIICLSGAYYAFVKKLKETHKHRGIKDKLTVYKSGLYSQWFILEFSCLFSIISYIITGDLLLIFITIFSIIIFLINRPTIERTCDDLELDSNERRILKTKDAAI